MLTRSAVLALLLAASSYAFAVQPHVNPTFIKTPGSAALRTTGGAAALKMSGGDAPPPDLKVSLFFVRL